MFGGMGVGVWDARWGKSQDPRLKWFSLSGTWDLGFESWILSLLLTFDLSLVPWRGPEERLKAQFLSYRIQVEEKLNVQGLTLKTDGLWPGPGPVT